MGCEEHECGLLREGEGGRVCGQRGLRRANRQSMAWEAMAGKEGKPLDMVPLEVDAPAARGSSRVELRGSRAARTLTRASGKRLVTLLKGGGRL